ncbi:MAG: hypothetical protein A2Y38_19710 [Spirochaetes bacterium GWB1_59_5]|nr:MAG: hypothetical protein A2Y38_19710 [Spirochaetes bacterium GWB1_59_5]
MQSIEIMKALRNLNDDATKFFTDKNVACAITLDKLNGAIPRFIRVYTQVVHKSSTKMVALFFELLELHLDTALANSLLKCISIIRIYTYYCHCLMHEI